MSDEYRSSTSTGMIVLAVCVLVMLCSGSLVVLVGGGLLLFQTQAAREQELRARILADLAERQLPPGAHAIAIGPDGELFLDDVPTDLAGLKEKLASLVPPAKRDSTEIYIRPGLLAPPDVVSQVEELTQDFDQTVDPLPGSGTGIQIAPEEDEEPAEPKR
jgi:hypothetical protein